MLDTYQFNLAGLLLANGLLLGSKGSKSNAIEKLSGHSALSPKRKRYDHVNQSSQWAFFVVYALVMGSDWMQGPFLYSLYKNEHGLSSQLIAQLFNTGFLSGAITAPFIGTLADRYGRRTACLFFCAASIGSCLLTAFPALGANGKVNNGLLFAGRALGGLATSLLFSVFESWMVTDFKSRFLEAKGGNLSKTFGTMGTVNSMVAIISGVLSEWLVGITGTAKMPFVASTGLVIMASFFMLTQWDENYGSAGQKRNAQPSSTAKNDSPTPNLWQTLTSKGVLAVALASMTFEGSMYLFVVLWAPMLQSVAPAGSLPYGLIFASFMAMTLLSSIVYPKLSSRLSPTALLAATLTIGSFIFLCLSSGPRTEQSTFWLFCAFEAAVGVYFPASGVLKEAVVPDSVRAQVYAALRLPLNIFVVLSLYLMGESTTGAASSVFGTCGVLLLGGAGAIWVAGGQNTGI